MMIERTTKLIRRGKYSFAIPVTIQELKILGIIDPKPNDELHLSVSDSKYDQTMQIESEKHYQERINGHSALAQMFDDWFESNHIAPEDREEYLTKVYDELRADEEQTNSGVKGDER